MTHTDVKLKLGFIFRMCPDTDVHKECYRTTEHLRLEKCFPGTLQQVREWSETPRRLLLSQHVKKFRMRPWLQEQSQGKCWIPAAELNHELDDDDADGCVLPYPKILQCEYNFLMYHSSALSKLLLDARPVELGFNESGQVCKLAYLLPLHELVPHIYDETSTPRRASTTSEVPLLFAGDLPKMVARGKIPPRYLFVCVGQTGIIKTLYFKPTRIKRDVWNSKHNIEYKNALWFATQWLKFTAQWQKYESRPLASLEDFQSMTHSMFQSTLIRGEDDIDPESDYVVGQDFSRIPFVVYSILMKKEN